MKKKYLPYLLLFCLMMIGMQSIAQQSIKSEKEASITISPSEFKKTIQFMFLASEQNNPIGLTIDLINKIENLRQEDKITYLDVNQGCKIKILAKNLIYQKNFVPLEEYVVVEKFSN
ncbi:MAG: hypothetical protein H7141_12875 [Burkholderiales bacterium]|nr:hypothetical protein [Bacteroidia bacterium]